MITMGVMGCGHWGPNHIRIFNQLPDSEVSICTDLDAGRLNTIHTLYPQVKTTTNHKEVFMDKNIDAVCISTPTSTHYELTKEALEHGKHVFVEKPLAMTAEECEELDSLSSKKKKIVMVGHVFVFNNGIMCLKDYVQSGELGQIQYAHSVRTNLGPFRYDVNALWDLAPHDISIFNYLFDACPVNVTARGHKCLGPTLEDFAFASMEYPKHIMANVHVSWLDPKKVRQITIVGDKKMVVWDDLDNVGPIKLYDKHVEKTSSFYQTYGEFQLLSREGSIMIPNIGFDEPLKTQAQYFIECVSKGKSPERADISKGRDVVKTLCAMQESINKHGTPVDIK